MVLTAAMSGMCTYSERRGNVLAHNQAQLTLIRSYDIQLFFVIRPFIVIRCFVALLF